MSSAFGATSASAAVGALTGPLSGAAAGFTSFANSLVADFDQSLSVAGTRFGGAEAGAAGSSSWAPGAGLAAAASGSSFDSSYGSLGGFAAGGIYVMPEVVVAASAIDGDAGFNGYQVAMLSLAAVGAFETAAAFTEGTEAMLGLAAGGAPLALPAAAITATMAGFMFLAGFGLTYAAIRGAAGPR